MQQFRAQHAGLRSRQSGSGREGLFGDLIHTGNRSSFGVVIGSGPRDVHSSDVPSKQGFPVRPGGTPPCSTHLGEHASFWWPTKCCAAVPGGPCAPNQSVEARSFGGPASEGLDALPGRTVRALFRGEANAQSVGARREESV